MIPAVLQSWRTPQNWMLSSVTAQRLPRYRRGQRLKAPWCVKVNGYLRGNGENDDGVASRVVCRESSDRRVLPFVCGLVRGHNGRTRTLITCTIDATVNGVFLSGHCADSRKKRLAIPFAATQPSSSCALYVVVQCMASARWPFPPI